jgi:hypothetical protein
MSDDSNTFNTNGFTQSQVQNFQDDDAPFDPWRGCTTPKDRLRSDFKLGDRIVIIRPGFGIRRAAKKWFLIRIQIIIDIEA